MWFVLLACGFATLLGVGECQPQGTFANLTAYLNGTVLRPPVSYQPPIPDPRVPVAITAVHNNPFSLIGCQAASNYSAMTNLTVQLGESIKYLQVGFDDGTTQQTGTLNTSAQSLFFRRDPDEFIISLKTCVQGAPISPYSNQGGGFRLTTSKQQTFDASVCSPLNPFCECTDQFISSGVPCGVYGYGPDNGPTGSTLNATYTGAYALKEINAIGFAFFKVPSAITVSGFTYPTIGSALVQLQPQEGTAIDSAVITNNSTAEQSQTRTVTLTKTVTSSWSSTSSFQKAFAIKQTSSKSSQNGWGASLTASVKAGVKIPFIGGGDVSISTTGSLSGTTTATTGSETDISSQLSNSDSNSLEYSTTYTYTHSYPIIIPPLSQLTWTAQLRSGTIDLPYSATLTLTIPNGGTALRIPFQGTYNGISASGSTVVFQSTNLTSSAG